MDIDLTNAHPCPDCRQCLTTEAKCSYCAERDALKQQLDAAVERAERAEKHVELLGFANAAHSENLLQHSEEVGTLRARAEAAEATVAGLREALDGLHTATSKFREDWGALGVAFSTIDKALVESSTAISATPAQHAARIRERVLREAVDRAEKETEDEKSEDSSFFYGIVTADTLREWADEAAKEAQNG